MTYIETDRVIHLFVSVNSNLSYFFKKVWSFWIMVYIAFIESKVEMIWNLE